MPVRTEIDSEADIIRKIYSGDIFLTDILSGLESTAQIAMSNNRGRLIADFRPCTLHVSPEEIAGAAEKAKQLQGKYPERIAILIDRPEPTALSLLFERRTEGTYECRVFSTEEAAIDWLSEK